MKGTETNRCFANAAIQALFTSHHVKAILADEAKKDGVLTHLRILFLAEKNRVQVTQSADAITRHVAEKALRNGYPEDFANGQQHDSCDFLMHLLNCSPRFLKPLFAIKVSRWVKCQACPAPELLSSQSQHTIVEVKRPATNVALQFGIALKDEQDMEKRCRLCSPPGDASESANRLHKERMVLELAPGAQHLILKFPIHQQMESPAGLPLYVTINGIREPKLQHCKGKLTEYKAAGFHIQGANMRTDAAAVKVGTDHRQGHYYALTREGTAWLKKDDTNVYIWPRFLTNLKGAYYTLLTKV
jgi:hypothetical protein